MSEEPLKARVDRAVDWTRRAYESAQKLDVPPAVLVALSAAHESILRAQERLATKPSQPSQPSQYYWVEIYGDPECPRNRPWDWGRWPGETPEDAVRAALDIKSVDIGRRHPGAALYARASAREGESWLTDVLMDTAKAPE